MENWFYFLFGSQGRIYTMRSQFLEIWLDSTLPWKIDFLFFSGSQGRIYTMRSQILILVFDCQSGVVPWLQSPAPLFSASAPSVHLWSHFIILSSASYLSASFDRCPVLGPAFHFVCQACKQHYWKCFSKPVSYTLVSISYFYFINEILTSLKIIAKLPLASWETDLTFCVWICQRKIEKYLGQRQLDRFPVPTVEH